MKTPLEISILLHYATHADAFEPKTELSDCITAQYVKDGILERRDRDKPSTSKYAATEKGRAWLEIICATPYPVSHWIDPRSQIGMSIIELARRLPAIQYPNRKKKP
jgi:DNA-binding PadR family transcriptional regulator